MSATTTWVTKLETSLRLESRSATWSGYTPVWGASRRSGPESLCDWRPRLRLRTPALSTERESNGTVTWLRGDPRLPPLMLASKAVRDVSCWYTVSVSSSPAVEPFARRRIVKSPPTGDHALWPTSSSVGPAVAAVCAAAGVPDATITPTASAAAALPTRRRYPWFPARSVIALTARTPCRGRRSGASRARVPAHLGAAYRHVRAALRAFARRYRCRVLLVARDPAFRPHDPGRGHPERAARLEAVHDGLTGAGVGDSLVDLAPRDATVAELERVHSAALLDGLRRLSESGGGAIDPDTTTSSGSWAAAVRAAGAGLAAAEALERGDGDAAFLALRPPGHHATAARAMGFCLVNHVAVTAAALVDRGERVLVVDYDAHHGNGTQDIFYAEPRVLYVSFHEWPL